jgi:Double zinc ribbon
MAMDADTQVETSSESPHCPQCGSKENGYFCRRCGTLLRGEEMVLCPRCHEVVPNGEFCNQCGQSLGGIALQLRQLAEAGDAFWVTAGVTESPDGMESTLFGPDESVELAEAELPEWVRELSPQSAPPDIEARIYPSLRPLEQKRQGAAGQGRFLIVVILLSGLLLLSLVFITFFMLLSGGG